MWVLGLAAATVGACGGSAAQPVRAPLENLAPPIETVARPRLTLDAELAMMPVDTEMVMELDVARLRRSVLWERMEPWLRGLAGPSMVEVVQMCGFDPLLTVDSILIGARGLGGSVEATMLVRGFERTAVIACLERATRESREQGGNRSAHMDGDLVELLEGDAVSMAIRFVDDRTVLLLSRNSNFADRAALDEAARRQLGQGLTSSPAFLAVIGRIDTGATCWFAANGTSAPFKMLPIAVRAVRSELHTSADPARALLGSLVMEHDDATSASSLAGMVRMAFDSLRGGPFTDLAQAMEISEEGTDVIVDLRFDLDQLQRIASLLGMAWP